ncbi:MAG: cyclic nucleotide-binding domain-containing protein [Rhodospirillales bacterium]
MLGNTPVLAALPDDVQVRIAGFAQEKVFRRGQTVFSKGDPGSNMMIVAEGWVCLRGLSADGAQITFAIARPGDVFGEMAMLDNDCREG